MKKIFIDGSVGTTGLRIYERLSVREDIQLILLPEEYRKDREARKDALQKADIAFLCLPDNAAVEAVELLEDADTAIIDTSTAHRTAEGWIYGFAELKEQKGKIMQSKRIANPGCHASGFIALVAPLLQENVLKKESLLSCFSLTGYSGGGKGMIAEYEAADRSPLLNAPRQYGLSQQHKHLKEMITVCGLENNPAFCPIVADFYSGMEVTVPLFAPQVKANLQEIQEIYQEYYHSPLVYFSKNPGEGGFLSAAALAGRDDMEISVFGNDDRILLTARFDNLGKGASGAAIQNMNILMGVEETKGLIFGKD